MTDDVAPHDAKSALLAAARQFRLYEAHHRAEASKANIGGIAIQGSAAELVAASKLHDDRTAKAEVNRLEAEMCEEAAAEVIMPPSPVSIEHLDIGRSRTSLVLNFNSREEREEAFVELNRVFARREAHKKDPA